MEDTFKFDKRPSFAEDERFMIGRCLKKTRRFRLSSTQRLPSLDGLRGVSILLVLLAHSTGATNFPQRLWFLEELGEFGVLVFFVISGFLITTLLMRERAAAEEISLR
jgi:peptidoglycan/LPS O-acetylase OafA/YrhL